MNMKFLLFALVILFTNTKCGSERLSTPNVTQESSLLTSSEQPARGATDEFPNTVDLCTDSTAKILKEDTFGSKFSNSNLMISEKAWDIVRASQSLFVVGTIQTSADNFDLFLRRYDNGKLVFMKQWDNGPLDVALAMASDDSYLYVGGFSRTKVAGIYTNQGLLQKYDLLGNLIWTRLLGQIGGGHHEVDGLALVGDALYVSRWAATYGVLSSQAVIEKFNKQSGDLAWSQAFGDSGLVTTADGHIFADLTGVWLAGRIN